MNMKTENSEKKQMTHKDNSQCAAAAYTNIYITYIMAFSLLICILQGKINTFFCEQMYVFRLLENVI